MNRRTFLRCILSIIALFPFIPWKKSNKPIIFGIDKAKPDEDQTIFQIYKSQGTTIIPLDEYAKLMGYDNLFVLRKENCRCAFEYKWSDK